MSAWAGLVTAHPYLPKDQHITLVYNENASPGDFMEMRRIVRRCWEVLPDFWDLPITGVDLFGIDSNVPVLLVGLDTLLFECRRNLEHLHDSSFNTWIPHIAVQDVSYQPATVPVVGIQVSMTDTWRSE